jgi:hypothetical protein
MIVANVLVERPHQIVRATVPLAEPVVVVGGVSPFTLYSRLGEKLQTQCEIVARDVDNNGASIVELIALDPVAAGGLYAVHDERQRDGSTKLAQWTRLKVSMPPTFDMGNGVQIATRWASGYVRNGDVAVTRRFYGPHFVGWLTAYAGQSFVEVALRFHNSEPVSPPYTFKSLRLVGDAGEGVEFVVPEPNANGLELVPARADGKLHFLRQRQVREFRFLWHEGQANVDAIAYARGGGFGVSDAWTRVGGWGPTKQRLPNLPAPMLSNARTWLSAEWSRLDNGIRTGAAVDIGLSLARGAIGFGYTTGSNHGGVTGGGGRELFDSYGVLTALTGSTSGLRFLQAKCAAVAYRTPALIDAEGLVCEYESWVDATGLNLGGWQVSAADPQFERRGADVAYYDGAFGFYSKRAVPEGIDLADWTAQAAIAPVDFQHYVRAFSAASSLAYLANDPMAKQAVFGMAEAHRMSMHTAGRLAGEVAHVNANPGKLTAWGRAHGHGYDCQAVAYLLGSPRWRRARKGDLIAFGSTIVAAQAANGCLQSTAGHKGQTGAPFNGQHRVQKATEATFLAHAAYGCLKVAEGDGYSDAAEMIAVCAVEGFAKYHNGAGQGSPHDWVAVQPPSRTSDPYETAPPVTNWWDRTEVPIVYGIALQRCRELGFAPPAALTDAIRRYCGNAPDPRAWLLAQTLHKLDIADTIPLLAALEPAP